MFFVFFFGFVLFSFFCFVLFCFRFVLFCLFVLYFCFVFVFVVVLNRDEMSFLRAGFNGNFFPKRALTCLLEKITFKIKTV